MILIAVLLASVPLASATSTKVNPIRKVVNLLQAMQEKVTKEAQMADELYDKFMCYCKNSGSDLAKAIEATEGKLAQLGPDIKAAESKKEQTEEDLETSKDDRSKAQKTMTEDTAIRDKDHKDFEKELADEEAEIKAVDQTVETVGKAAGSSSLLQSEAAGTLRSYLSKRRLHLNADKRELLAFLSNEGSGSQPGSSEILGTLGEIKNEMTEDKKEIIHQEEEANHAFEERMDSKKKEVGALKKVIENKLDRVGRLGVEIASMKGDLEDSSGSLEEDKAFLKNMEKNCKEKTAIHEQEKKMRAQEIVALADTIKILNDDDALELFKKTLPGTAESFLQLQTTASSMRAQAKELLAQARSRIHPGQGAVRLDFISLALHGDKVGMAKVIGLIDRLIATVTAEQGSDDHKKEYCTAQFSTAEAKQADLKRSSKDLTTAIEETKEGLATVDDEVAALKTGIAELDKTVAEATEQRKAENTEYKALMANNAAAKELIVMAKQRLGKFYNPKGAKGEAPKEEAPKEEAPKEEAPKEAAAAPAFVQMAAGHPPPPETMAAYTKKSEQSGGVLQMMDVLVNDLDAEMIEAKTEEKLAQEEYEQTMADSSEKRAADAKSLGDKEGSKAEMKNVLETSTAEKKAAEEELMAVASFLQTLHSECDWLVEYYDVRKEARTEELDALKKAKGVLNGAEDIALLQLGKSKARTRKFLHLQKSV